MKEPMVGVSIEFMYAPLPFPERIAKAAADGFQAVEFWDWRNKDMDSIGEAAEKAGVKITGFFGNRLGSIVDPRDRQRNLEGLHESLDVAKKVGAKYIHVFTNEIQPGSRVVPLSQPLSREEQFAEAVEGFKEAVKLAARYDIPLLLEAINPVFVPGYFLDHADLCKEMCDAVDSPYLPMIYDFYHQQLSRGNLVETFKRCQDRVEAVHVASVPGRHEPNDGEVNYRYIERELRAAGYDGLITFEVTPREDAERAVAGIKEIFGGWFPA
jgi:hydroxypyruvate isomerase